MQAEKMHQKEMMINMFTASEASSKMVIYIKKYANRYGLEDVWLHTSVQFDGWGGHFSFLFEDGKNGVSCKVKITGNVDKDIKKSFFDNVDFGQTMNIYRDWNDLEKNLENAFGDVDMALDMRGMGGPDVEEYDFDKFSPSQPLEIVKGNNMRKEKIINAVLREAGAMKEIFTQLTELGYERREIEKMTLDEITDLLAKHKVEPY